MIIEMVIDKLSGLIEPIMNLSKDRRDLRDNALRAIAHALNETLIYYSNLERGHQRNSDIEAQLSKYWSAAAIPMRHIDEHLALVCDVKSNYWIKPEDWDDRRIKKVGISLKEVQKSYRALLVSRARLKLGVSKGRRSKKA